MTHPLHRVWSNMKQRCENPNRPDYKYYGAKGVTVCAEWQTFAGFAETRPVGWLPGLELDRRDATLGYSPDNCRWVSVQVNRQNRGIFCNNTSGLTGVGWGRKGFRARAGKGGVLELYYGPDFFEACCARKSWDATQRGVM